MTESLKLVIDVKATLGEGPCWDAVNQGKTMVKGAPTFAFAG
jgi:hypothetical protein